MSFKRRTLSSFPAAIGRQVSENPFFVPCHAPPSAINRKGPETSTSPSHPEERKGDTVRINLFVVGHDIVSMAGLVAILHGDDRVRLLGQGVAGPDTLRLLGSLEDRDAVVLLGGPFSGRALHENVREISEALRRRTDHPKIIIVSQNEQEEIVVTTLRTGVSGYLTHLASREDLLRCLQVVAGGGTVLGPAVAAQLARHLASGPSVAAGVEFPGLVENLTEREQQILSLLAEGLGNHQIARRLCLAEKTVRNYVSRIFTKLQVHDRAAVAVRARDAGVGVRGPVRPPQR